MRADEQWEPFAVDYDNKVFSVTSFEHHRRRLLEHSCGEPVLNLGCGPTPHLNRALLEAGYTVVASDFCARMLDEAKGALQHPRLTYVRADSCHLPFMEGAFDTIISVNSILPERREDVVTMFREAHRALAPNGRFLAYLVAFDLSLEALASGIPLVVDEANCRDFDTTGWQCFHTPDTIARELAAAGVARYDIAPVPINSPSERRMLERLYGISLGSLSPYEHFLRFTK